MTESPTSHDERFRLGIALFNAEEFFDCHDVWEDLWSETLGEPRDFLQGLIQVSVCLFHLGNRNWGGAYRLYRSSSMYLEPYLPTYWGIDLERLRSELHRLVEPYFEARDLSSTDEFVPPTEYPQIHPIED